MTGPEGEGTMATRFAVGARVFYRNLDWPNVRYSAGTVVSRHGWKYVVSWDDCGPGHEDNGYRFPHSSLVLVCE
jgi:hypothetical protein